ncbi:hypothetical protein PR048_031474 [Dryococelus australis]|uniref:Uncharacterized protein n=1 Tax=Dryococelus australis TaxID=614101 RepID=A0ABQ9G826_9NEOP|nr:hypothetical protein PR048_031474 [Dryococelus australis]
MEGNVIKLSFESNWKTWKFQTGVTLRAKGVYDVVNGTCVKPEPESDDYERALKEWLQKDFLAQDLNVTRLDKGPMPGESIVEDTVSNLKQLGEKLSETMIETKILMALPST